CALRDASDHLSKRADHDKRGRRKFAGAAGCAPPIVAPRIVAPPIVTDHAPAARRRRMAVQLTSTPVQRSSDRVALSSPSSMGELNGLTKMPSVVPHHTVCPPRLISGHFAVQFSFRTHGHAVFVAQKSLVADRT